MALSTPSASPAVVVKEIDLTGGVPNVQSTTGATVGNFRWGKQSKRVLIDNETSLVNTFASPDSANTIDFHSASYFLRYSGSLQVVREVTSSAQNARSTTGQLGTDNDGSLPTELVKNDDDFAAQQSALDSDSHTLIARYPGELGNSIQVSICPPNSTAFGAWSYKDDFDAAPSTSDYANNKNASNDEIHVVVVDNGGELTGTKGTVLERYPFVSIASDAKNADGTTNYAKDIINARSEYIHMVGFDSDYAGAGAGTTADSGDNFSPGLTAATNHAFTKGANSGALTTTEYLAGFDLFEDKDIVEVDFLVAPSMNSRADQTTVVNDLISTASQTRKDCVVTASPARTDVINLTNTTTITNNITATADTFTASSYLVMDGNFLKVYDKYNDQYIQIPAASSTAGIMAATDLNRAPWFSPAGSRRGGYLGITAISWSPTKAQRDTLYKAAVNPIANIPGKVYCCSVTKRNLVAHLHSTESTSEDYS